MEVIEALLDSVLGPIGPAILGMLPSWAATFIVIIVTLSRTGILDRWAVSLSFLFQYIKDKKQLEVEREQWSIEREAELDRIQLDATIQANVAKQLSDQKAQQQLYNILGNSMKFMQDELRGEVSRLNKKVSEIEKIINERLAN